MSRKRLDRHERRELIEMRLVERRGDIAEIVVLGSNPTRILKLHQRHMICISDTRWEETPSGGMVRAEHYRLTDRGRVTADQLILREFQRYVHRTGFGEAMVWVNTPEISPYVAPVRTRQGDMQRFELQFRGRIGLETWPATFADSNPTVAVFGETVSTLRQRARDVCQLAKSFASDKPRGTKLSADERAKLFAERWVNTIEQLRSITKNEREISEIFSTNYVAATAESDED